MQDTAIQYTHAQKQKHTHTQTRTEHPLGEGDEEEDGVGGVEEDGHEGVEGDDGRAVLAVALGQLDPDDDHGDAAVGFVWCWWGEGMGVSGVVMLWVRGLFEFGFGGCFFVCWGFGRAIW